MSFASERIFNFLLEFKEKKATLASSIFILMLCVISAFPHLFAPYEPMKVYGRPWEPPSLDHIFGLDDVGRDMLSILIYGTRTSIVIGFCAAFFASTIGLLIGLISGYYGGFVDNMLMRVTDFFLVIPSFPLMVALAFILKPGINTVILAIVIVLWTQPAKLIRAEVLSLKERPYIIRARVVGCSGLRILFKYILPRVFPLFFSATVMAMGWAIPSEAFLSWIGLGDPTNISWGIILYYAFQRGAFTAGAWWHFVPPGIMILLSVVALSILGHSLEEIFNPKLKRKFI